MHCPNNEKKCDDLPNMSVNVYELAYLILYPSLFIYKRSSLFQLIKFRCFLQINYLLHEA